MSPEQVESICKDLFGENWKGAMSDAFDFDYSTQWRILKRDEISGPVETALIGWAFLYRAFSILPPVSPYLAFVNTYGIEVGLAVDKINVDQIAKDLFGKKWKMPLATALGINASTLWRQMTSDDGLPGPIVASLRAWQLIHKLTGLVPPFRLGDNLPTPAPKPNHSGKKQKSKYGRLV